MSTERVHVIACGVLAVDIRHLTRELEIQTTFLPGGLHNNPGELRRRLQAAIDEVSAAGQATRIVVGYGVCGRGSVGIHARGVPLVIPRVHDCISLFLGSDAAYRREFARYPGTYYISAGWVQEKVQPKVAATGEKDGAGEISGKPTGMADPCSCGDQQGCVDPEFERLVEQYGGENAQAIRHFLSSWQRNYQRAAFIDTGAPEHHRYAQIAREMARRHGWKYQELRGSGELLQKLLHCRQTDAHVLWVPPHHATVYDPVGRGLVAVPVCATGALAASPCDQVIEVGPDAPPTEGGRARIGLGIDAGGTYTDVALYDFVSDRVLQKAKALTTKWDYTLGISAALDQLDRASLQQVDLVSISTTLATNAIVEGRGQKVGLLIMPPYGLFSPGDIDHAPVTVIEGQLDIDGSQKRPINPEQVARVAKQMIADGVGAFAVTGYASHINPAHELAVRQVLERETTLPVTCGHEVSDQLNYRIRAHTAALNGRIIPILVQFLRQAGECLRGRGIEAPMMVVRSDGSLMSVAAARHRPIETILSGPAASVAGARYLAKIPSAFVVDVGGTTTDTALILNGEVRTTRHGARVGGWQTHVQALDMRTAGLGGDSLLWVHAGELRLGPRRVVPIAWLGAKEMDLEPCFKWMQEQVEKHGLAGGLLDIYALNGTPDPMVLSEREQRIVQVLSARPYSAHELAARVQRHWGETLDMDRLEREHLVHRCGATPTDILHVAGLFQRWDVPAAHRMVQIMALALKLEPTRLIQRVMELMVRGLTLEVLKKQLDETSDAEGLERSRASHALLNNWLAGGSSDFQVRIQLKHPVIGIGAPVGHFLPAAAKLLETQAIIPEHADVANAIGAITNSVMIRRQMEISPEPGGGFALQGTPGTPVFPELPAAREAAIALLKAAVTKAAREAGTSQGRIHLTFHDRIASLGDGGQAFVGQTIEARLSGRPDLARLAAAV